MAKQTKKAAPKAEAREVLYDTPSVHIAAGDDALDTPAAKELLGWEETDDKEAAIIKDRNGKWIYCRNNVKNRPLTMGNVDMLIQEILRKRWQLNGENLIVGKTGLLLNGQHTLIALVLAEQDRENEFKEYPEDARKEYRKNWANPITIDKSVFYGVEETDSVVNTMDTCKPRSLWEVICLSPYFASMKLGDRKTASKICEHAVRMIWHRTGAGNAFNLRKTHAESLNFIERHQTLLKCVRHIFEEDGGADRKIAKYISPGYAAGLMYLMACSTTEGEKYHASNSPSEKHLDFAMFDKASEFWLFLADGSPEFKPLRDAIAGLANPVTGTGGTMAEKVAVLIKAWGHYLAGDGFTAKRLELKYAPNDNGDNVLAEWPETGGIDKGPNPDDEDDDETNGDKKIPTPEELLARKEAERQKHIDAKRDEDKAKAKAEAASKEPVAPKKSPKQIMDEKREAEAKALDAAKTTEPAPVDTSAPVPAPTVAPNGFKARPNVKLPPIKPGLRGGI